jgi:methylmalonyl-CoA mutase N-terminal domain/subunit
MTISGPALPLFCTYVVAAERAGVAPAALGGTLQTDIFKEYIAQKEWLFPPEPHLRLIGDLLEWTQQHMPRYHPISISGYHIREAGATAAQELAFTLADGFGYVELGMGRGLAVDDFATRLSFFFDAHIDFFEEIAKFRAARRIWARWMRDRYGATTERAQWLRFHTQTAGVSLTAQQPENNVVRTAVEALAAVLGGTNSLHTNALDEVLALPTEATAEVALRTQHVLLEETGVASVIDPLGGSWFVEASTDRVEAEVELLLAEIQSLGHDGSMTAGIVAGIEAGWFTGHIADAADDYQRSVENGDRRVVGVNVHTESVAEPLAVLRIPGEVETDQVEDLLRRRSTRDNGVVQERLGALALAARTSANLVPPMLDAVRAEATVGELCATLRDVFGGYTEPPDF